LSRGSRIGEYCVLLPNSHERVRAAAAQHRFDAAQHKSSIDLFSEIDITKLNY
jgi:hypothetical protein